jgi:hypothetical protein
VRVARALGTLPRLAHALATGEVSYSKVRAITRVATLETEERLLGFARAGTAVHVERLVRAWRYMDRKTELEASARLQKRRALQVYPRRRTCQPLRFRPYKLRTSGTASTSTRKRRG